ITAQVQPEVTEPRPLHPYEARTQYRQCAAQGNNQGYTDCKAPHEHSRPDRDIGTRLNSNGGDAGGSLDAFLHRGGGFRAVTTGPRAPTDYRFSLALDSAAACGADRITTQRGRCARCFSQAATREANVV